MKILVKIFETKAARLCAIVLTGALSAVTLAGCDNPAGADGKPPLAGEPQTAAYTSEDNSGNRYTLIVTEKTGRAARYAAKNGDAFSLTVELLNNGDYRIALSYSGTIDTAEQNGNAVEIALTVNGQPLQITIAGAAMTLITGTIKLDNGETITSPGEVKQVPAIPTASPLAGEYASAPQISLSSATEGAVIYYHVFAGDSFVSADDIIENGTEYTGPFTLSPFPGTLKAAAVKDGLSSRLLTAQYTKSGTQPNPDSTADIYIVGSEYDDSNITFCYWKNGVKVPLTVDGYAMIQDIVVSGSDVYVLGHDFGSGACYWKNGVKTLLPGAVQAPGGMAISGSDVYVIGGYDIAGGGWGACYWKNGARTALSTNESFADAIAISASGDVYIAGVDERTTTIEDGYSVPSSKACFWKNGVRTLLTDGTNSADTRAIALSGEIPYIVGNISVRDAINHTTSHTACYWRNTVKSDLITAYNPVMDDIIVSGSDVYVLGKVREHADGEWYAAYWKNGNKVSLSNMSDYGAMHGKLMAVSGSNVYVAGDSGGSACYWKNGARNVLSPENSHAAAIAVNGTDFYIAGSESIGGNSTACYWKNGVKVSLQSAAGMQSNASAIAVVAK